MHLTKREAELVMQLSRPVPVFWLDYYYGWDGENWCIHYTSYVCLN